MSQHDQPNTTPDPGAPDGLDANAIAFRLRAVADELAKTGDEKDAWEANVLTQAAGVIAAKSGDLPPHPDTGIVDFIASHWDSQMVYPQFLLHGRAIENPTGSFRDAIRAVISARAQAGKEAQP